MGRREYNTCQLFVINQVRSPFLSFFFFLNGDFRTFNREIEARRTMLMKVVSEEGGWKAKKVGWCPWKPQWRNNVQC